MNQSPNRLRSDRHINVADAEGRESVNDGVYDCWRCADCSCFADTFDAHWVHVRRRLSTVKLEPGKHRSFRHGVVHQRACDELPLLVIDYLFIKRLTDCLNYAALNLPDNEHWSNH